MANLPWSLSCTLALNYAPITVNLEEGGSWAKAKG